MFCCDFSAIAWIALSAAIVFWMSPSLVPLVWGLARRQRRLALTAWVTTLAAVPVAALGYVIGSRWWPELSTLWGGSPEQFSRYVVIDGTFFVVPFVLVACVAMAWILAINRNTKALR